MAARYTILIYANYYAVYTKRKCTIIAVKTTKKGPKLGTRVLHNLNSCDIFNSFMIIFKVKCCCYFDNPLCFNSSLSKLEESRYSKLDHAQ